MNEQNQLAVQEPSVASMLSGMLSNIQQSQITPASVEVLKGMMDLYERNEDRQAKKDFSVALAAMQAETGTIQAMTAVKNRDGTERYRYAKFEHIMEKARPIMSKHGFSHSFDTKSGEGTLTAIFKLTHKSGHSETNQFTVRVGKGQGTNDMQDDMGSKSYAKRGAVCDGLGIIISHDTDGDDPRGLGGLITKEQADDLRKRVKETGADEHRFLIFANAETYEDIHQSKLGALDEHLTKKAKTVKP